MVVGDGRQNERRQIDADADRLLKGVARGAAGALIFGLPMLMTMELWFLGFYMERYRLLILLLANLPLLVVLAHRIGFEETFTWSQALRDAVIAYGIAIAMSAAVLTLLGIAKLGMPPTDIVGKIVIQAVPASIGALLGRSQLGGEDQSSSAGDDQNENDFSTSYGRELFMMAIGALFLSLNVAPTEEIILISYKMTPWHATATVALSILVMHAFVYAVAFRGAHQLTVGTPRWHALIRFTLPGYVVALLMSLYVLWTLGRLDDTTPAQILMSAIVLGFPGAVGAAAARLIL
ncbi:TIGR02587 family membrane protein [Rhizobium halophilum]|uniref:TIGR02587 family membrane protein n=1 Tax=Rhizobium halophilum TaxID=2846852 RepID=UPI001EFEA2D0|nr:TIGR02587 family membrane protein [Rhizobium halophilum]MCF6370279.1 TIGR02587 family membrane protein [Rhizobium halophilum]